jgi:NADP-dependent 3-hydroxy acid dehydrogenase YdfG
MNIFISGISSGIGKAMAINLADNGFKVYGISRSKLSYKHKNITHMVHDINNTEKTPLEMLENVDSLDYVLLNAGVLGEISNIKDAAINDLKKTTEINLWSQKRLIDNLLDNHKVSHIYGLSSGAAIKGSKGWSGYSISKAAFKMLIELYASEIDNTQFLSIAPGLVNTQMQDYICDTVDKEEFPNMQRLKDARDNGSMNSPDQLAKKFINQFSFLKTLDSGNFIDLRSLD